MHSGTILKLRDENKNFDFVDYHEITRAEVFGNYVTVYLRTGTKHYYIHKSLKAYFAEMVHFEIYKMANKGCFVNVLEIKKEYTADCHLLMKDETCITTTEYWYNNEIKSKIIFDPIKPKPAFVNPNQLLLFP